MTGGRTSGRAVILLAAALALLPAVMVRAGQVLTVVQSRRAFSVADIRVQRGDSVRFQNADTFLHHIAVSAPGFSSGEQEPGQSLEVRFPSAGQFAVRCEIHPRMALTVLVE